jgi:predicted nucleic acid-binding protein
VHHQAARRWLAALNDAFATCPITEGTLVRHFLRQGKDSSAAQAVLAAIHEHPRHEFWPDSVSYRDVPLAGVIGHQQVTDAYLAQLARVHRGKLVTLDRGLAALHTDVVELIPPA